MSKNRLLDFNHVKGLIKNIFGYLVRPKLFKYRLTYGTLDIPLYTALSHLREQGRSFHSIVDVGAHEGEFALSALLAFPDCKQCISFEPQAERCENYRNKLRDFKAATVIQAALGEENTSLPFQLSQSTTDSSFLSAKSDYMRQNLSDAVTIPVHKLDDILSDKNLESPTLLKLDCQGYEMYVLRGAENTLKNVSAVLIEILFSQHYEGQANFDDIYSFLISRGFRFIGPYNTYFDPYDHGVQFIDAVFVKS